jgi:hypothetical protein
MGQELSALELARALDAVKQRRSSSEMIAG